MRKLLPFLLLTLLTIPIQARGQEVDNDLSDTVQRDAKVLLGELRSPDKGTRLKACKELQALGEEAEEALPAILEVLDKDLVEAVQVEAVKILGELPGKTEDTVPVLIELIANRAGPLQTSAVVVLGTLSEDSEKVLPCLIESTKSKSSMVRVYSLNALKSLGPKAKAAIPALKESIFDRHPMARRLAAQSLVAIGSESIEVLRELSKNKDEDTKKLALSALLDLGSSEDLSVTKLLEVYTTLVGVTDRDMTNLTVGMLARILERDGRPETLDRILNTVSRTKDENGRSGLIVFLNSLNMHWSRNKFQIKNRKALVPMFKKLLRSKKTRVQSTTLRLIRYLEDDADELVPVLMELAKDKNLASQVTYSVRYLGKKAVPVYIKMLENKPDMRTKMNVVRQIGYLRSNGREALPYLKKMKKSETDKRLTRYIDRSIRYIEMAKNPKPTRLKVDKRAQPIRPVPPRLKLKPQKLVPKKK